MTIVSNVHQVPDRPARSVPIGVALPGYTGYVLDERLRPAPAGELYIGGGAFAHGYAGQPARTAERFVADPFSPLPGSLMYRTGDLVTTDSDGVPHFRGRIDDQVKIRGIRVEPGEVRVALEEHPAVASAVVAATPDDRGDHTLVAFWLARAGVPAPSAEELRRHCRSRLADAAVPRRFEPVTSIPLDRNGKADRGALLRAMSATGGLPAEPDGRWTGVERDVAAMWSAVLEHHDFGPGDGFFDMGGDSARIIALHKRIQRRWPGVLRVGELFDLTTVRAQAAALTRRTGPEPVEANSAGGASYEV